MKETTQNSLVKTSTKEDKFNLRFIEMASYKKIVQAINFDTSNPWYNNPSLAAFIEATSYSTQKNKSPTSYP